mmetsp:Transcript_26640/g.85758  ORF Transcript_26640/g.85758 Transcript_26640/m.85758 type:complete len:283 (+) Transcript_26640:886-1734(+)
MHRWTPPRLRPRRSHPRRRPHLQPPPRGIPRLALTLSRRTCVTCGPGTPSPASSSRSRCWPARWLMWTSCCPRLGRATQSAAAAPAPAHRLRRPALPREPALSRPSGRGRHLCRSCSSRIEVTGRSCREPPQTPPAPARHRSVGASRAGHNQRQCLAGLPRSRAPRCPAPPPALRPAPRPATARGSAQTRTQRETRRSGLWTRWSIVAPCSSWRATRRSSAASWAASSILWTTSPPRAPCPARRRPTSTRAGASCNQRPGRSPHLLQSHLRSMQLPQRPRPR